MPFLRSIFAKDNAITLQNLQQIIHLTNTHRILRSNYAANFS